MIHPSGNMIPHRPVHDRRGVALLLVLISMATATTLTLGWLASQDNAAPLSRNISHAAQSRAVASSGLELAVAIMQTNSDWRTMHSGGQLLNDHEMSPGRVDVRLTDVATNLPPVAGSDTIHIQVTARVEDFTQYIEAIASVVNTGSPDSEDVSGFAVWVGDGLELKGHSSIRRWEEAPMSSLGRRLFIGIDSEAPRSIDISSNALLADATIVHSEGASLALVRNEGIPGLRLRSTSSLFAPKPSPSQLPGYTGDRSSNGSFTPSEADWSSHPESISLGSGSTIHVPNGANLSMDSLELRSDTTLVIDGETTLHVHGELLIENASIVLNPGASLNLACGGDLTLRNAYIGDAGGEKLDEEGTPSWFDASKIQITTAGQPDDDSSSWMIAGDSLVKGIIEAPEHRLVMRDDSTVAGRIAVDHLRVRHRASVLYDHALDSGQGATKLALEKQSNGLDRIKDRLRSQFRRWRERMGFMQEDPPASGSDTIASRFGLAADDAWWKSPTSRETPIDLQLLVHGGDTDTWEATAALSSVVPKQ